MPLNPINVGAAANDNTGDSLRNAFIKVNSNNTYLDGKAPNAHTHPLSELTQSGATGGQVPTWNGTAWVPATPAESGTVTSVGLSLPNVFTVSNSPVTGAGTITATFASQSAGTVLAAPAGSSAAPSFRALVATDIPPLSYEASGAVSAHAALTSGAHGMSTYGSELVALTTAAAARTKLSLGTSSTLNVPAAGDASIAEVVLGTDTRLTNSRTPTAHVHGAGDVTSGIFDIGRIPTGSSGSTVCIGNDARLSDSRTPTAHTHALSDLTQSGATTGQVPSWNGTAWAPANVAASQNTFSTISIAGQSSVVADTTSDTLTLVAGTNITLTTDATTDTITISASGGSGGGGNVSGPNSVITDNALVRWDQVNTQIQDSGVTLSDTQEMSGLKSLAFSTAGGTVGLGSLTWDTTNQTLDLGIGAGTVNALLGVDSHVLGRNTSASPIVRGEVVLVNGASAGNLTVAKAIGTSDSNTANTIGLAAENIPNTGAVTTGMVITSGLLRNLNTQGFTAGQLLYISTAVEGGLTNVKPAAPNHAVRVGYVVSAHPSNGIIYVAINNGYELDELHDVAYPTTPATNDFLVYVTNRWENQTAATARTSMGLGTLATQSGTFSGSSSGTNTGDVTLAGTPTYITISGQTITRNQIALATDVSGTLPIANGGTGVTTSTGTGSNVLSDAPTFTGQIAVALGTAAAPAISFTGDSNTGIYSPAADMLGLVTGGVESFRVDATQRLIVQGTNGVSIPNGAGAAFNPAIVVNPTSGVSGIAVGVADGTNNRRIGMFCDQTNGIVGISTNASVGVAPIVFRSGSTEHLRIDTSGRVGIGTTNPSSFGGTATIVGAAASGILNVWSNDAGGGANVGGSIQLGGNDGSTSTRGYTAIRGYKENATSGDYASYLAFATRANGGSLTERMRIDSSGRVGIGTANPSSFGGANTLSVLAENQTAGGTISLYSTSAQSANFGGNIVLGGNIATSGTTYAAFAEIRGRKENSNDGNNAGFLSFATRVHGGSLTERMRIAPAGNVLINTNAVATTATDGFLYIPTCAGTPTGTPTTYTGRNPLVIDSTNSKLYFYNGSWVQAGGGGGGTSITNVWIPAAQWIPRTTTGCGIDSREQATGNINTDELLFDTATIEYAQAMVTMPSNYNNGTVTARFYWTASAGTASQTVTWAIRGRAFGDNVALGQTYTTAAQSVTDAYFSANQMHISDATSAVTIDGTPAANKPIIFEIYRDTADSLAADARLLGVEISYTAA